MNTTEHGPAHCHRRRCSADPCKEPSRERDNAHRRHKRRMEAYGRWQQPFVDPEPARAHVNYLRGAGMGIDRIHQLTGISEKALRSLVWGSEGRPPSGKIRAENAQKILAVIPTVDQMLPGARIDATGTRRRLQALQAIGWCQPALAERLGTVQPAVSRISRGAQSQVQAGMAIRVRALYDELWNQTPVPKNGYERGAIARSVRTAAARGWAPPMAWDDDAIDDPAAKAEGVSPGPNLVRKLPAGAELLWLIDELDETHEAIAQRFAVHIKTVKTAVNRARRKASQMEVSA